MIAASLKTRIALYSSRHYDALRSIFSESLLRRCGIRRRWQDIDGWFIWRQAQEEAVKSFPDGSRFVEVGTYLGRSLCSLGEVVEQSGKSISVIGIDTCRGSGPEGWRGKDYHASAVENGGGTLAGALHKNVLDCGFGEKITLIISDSVGAVRRADIRERPWHGAVDQANGIGKGIGFKPVADNAVGAAPIRLRITDAGIHSLHPDPESGQVI